MDTVKLQGKYFTPHVKKGDRVKKGQLIEEFDIDQIKKAGYSVITPVVITNSNQFKKIKEKALTGNGFLRVEPK